jgi:hypothetical protein
LEHIPGERITDPARVEATLEMFGGGWREHGLSHWVVRLGAGAYPGVAPDRVLSTNPASAKVAAKAGLTLPWRGEPSAKTRAAVGLGGVQRLIFADRTLAPEVLQWLVSRG